MPCEAVRLCFEHRRWNHIKSCPLCFLHNCPSELTPGRSLRIPVPATHAFLPSPGATPSILDISSVVVLNFSTTDLRLPRNLNPLPNPRPPCFLSSLHGIVRHPDKTQSTTLFAFVFHHPHDFLNKSPFLILNSTSQRNLARRPYSSSSPYLAAIGTRPIFC